MKGTQSRVIRNVVTPAAIALLLSACLSEESDFSGNNRNDCK